MPDRIDAEGKDTKILPKKRMVVLFAFLALLGAGFIIYQKIRSEFSKQDILVAKTVDVTKSNLETGTSLESLLMNLQKGRDRQLPAAPMVPEQPKPIKESTPTVPIQVYVTPKLQQQIYVPDDEMVKIGSQLRQAKIQALQAPSHVGGFVEQSQQQPAQQQQSQQSQTLMPQTYHQDLLGELGGNRRSSVPPDPNAQNEKREFMYSEGGQLTPQGYSSNVPIPQQFPYELKAGTVIPGIMISGINSDLPGVIMGQVSENVYDTSTGRYVLIPKGSRLIGVYDSRVTYGQNRVAVVWNRVIAPDGTSLNISGSPGMDRAGYSGMAGRVNEHWGRIITTALLASMFVAGAEIVNPGTVNGENNDNNRKSPRDVVAESVANTVLDVGARLMEKNSNIQPTIKIRPGTRFNVLVLQDVVFPNTWSR